MRKIALIKRIVPESFEVMIELREKMDDGSVVVHNAKPLQPVTSKYTREQQDLIDQCNHMLAEKGMDPLTGEESDYMLDPSGIKKRLDEIEKEMEHPENLQRLAGFKVEKRIVPV